MLRFALWLSLELFSLFAHGTVKHCGNSVSVAQRTGMLDTLSEMLNLLLPCLATI